MGTDAGTFAIGIASADVPAFGESERAVTARIVRAPASAPITRSAVRGAAFALVILAALCSSACVGAATRTGASGSVAEGDFARHVTRSRARLVARSLSGRAPAEIALNLPFERAADPAVPYRGRFLLFHGLNDSPAVWHDFADVLVARGFDVRAPLFAGHGSTPEEMLDVDHGEWLDLARGLLDGWLDEGDAPLHLGGFSMGGVVATLLALEEPRVSGLLLVSPAYRSSLNRWLRFSGLYARFRPWMFGGMILEDNPIKYNSIPINSGWQFYALTRALARRWRPDDRIDVPALLVVSSEDSVVDVAHTRRLFRHRFTHPASRLITYAPLVPEDGSPGVGAGFADIERDARPREETRDSRHPALRVLGQSHLSPMSAPSNALFGREGRVLVCNGNAYPVFMACMRARGHWYGAQHTPSPDGTPVARATWNPDWDHVVERLDEMLAVTKR